MKLCSSPSGKVMNRKSSSRRAWQSRRSTSEKTILEILAASSGVSSSAVDCGCSGVAAARQGLATVKATVAISTSATRDVLWERHMQASFRRDGSV